MGRRKRVNREGKEEVFGVAADVTETPLSSFSKSGSSDSQRAMKREPHCACSIVNNKKSETV